MQDNLFIHPFTAEQRSNIFQKWPELFSGDDSREQGSYFDTDIWRDFCWLRDQAVDKKAFPNEDNISSLKKHGAWLSWFANLNDRCGYGFDEHYFSGPLLHQAFRFSLQLIRTHWLSGLNNFLPDKNKEFFDDQEGWVSAIEDPFELLWFTLPNPSMDDELWRYRRWLARRDWFLANLGVVVSNYRDSLSYFNIGKDFDQYFKPGKEGFNIHKLPNGRKLPFRRLRWQGREIPVYTTWGKKDLAELTFKIIRREYSYNGGKIFDSIYDVLRGCVVTEEANLPFLQDFLSKVYPSLKLKERRNGSSAKGYTVMSYVGELYGHKFELQVQTLRDYIIAQHIPGEAHHKAYEAKRIYKLATLFLPASWISCNFDGFDYLSEGYRWDYQRHVLASIAG